MNRRDCIRTLTAAGGAALSGTAGCAVGTSSADGIDSLHREAAYPPYPSAEATESAFAQHVGSGPVKLMRALGTEIHYGQRERARVQDAFTKKWYWDCHRNGSLYNLGHRNPGIIATLRDALHHIEIGNLFVVSGYRPRPLKNSSPAQTA